jgi:DUF2934 family protein
MASIETGKTVLHRGREAPEMLREEMAELREEPQQAPEPPDERARRVAEAAYYIAERRNFEPGHELEDWLEAEAALRAREGWAA